MKKGFKALVIAGVTTATFASPFALAAPAGAAEVPPPALDATEQAGFEFKPGGLVLVFGDEGLVLGRFIGKADDDPDFVLVAGVSEGLIRAHISSVFPLPGPGNSSGDN